MVAVYTPDMSTREDLLRALVRERGTFSASSVMDRAREEIVAMAAENERLRADLSSAARLLEAAYSDEGTWSNADAMKLVMRVDEQSGSKT